MPGPGMLKRQKEIKRQERAQEKAAEKLQRKKEKATRGPNDTGEDPDIAGIIPGPQPILGEDTELSNVG